MQMSKNLHGASTNQQLKRFDLLLRQAERPDLLLLLAVVLLARDHHRAATVIRLLADALLGSAQGFERFLFPLDLFI